MDKCLECKEYNHEKHYCPKWCDVIRNTNEEMREFYKGEHEKLEKIDTITDGITEESNPMVIKWNIKEVLEQE